MIQFYFISVVYLVVAGLLHLFDTYRSKLLFLLAFRQALSDSKKLKVWLFIIGIIITVVLILFPVTPGPRFLGDLFPAIMVFIQSIYFLRFDGKYKELLKSRDKGWIMGYAIIAVAGVHFLFPSGVLI